MQRGDKGYWEWKAKTGRPKILKSPKQLREKICEYFAWCDANPMSKNEAIKSGPRAGAIVKVPVDRPYLWQDLERWLHDAGLVAKLDDYRANKGGAYDEFSDVLAWATKIIHGQKYSLALVGSYNPNLVSMELGMTQKTETTVIEQPLFPKTGK